MSILDKIKKTIKKKNESILIDLYLRDYDRSNFYFALVFNKKIEKFKVLYVPLDAIDESENVEEYFCYQFVFLHTVNYLLETIKSNEDKFDGNVIDKCSKNIDSYYIEFNSYVYSKEYQFKFTQYIDKEYKFLFDVVVSLFEHLPNVVNELCYKLLIDFNNSNEVYRYTACYDVNLDSDKLEDVFSKKIIKDCRYCFDDIDFIEKIGNRYYVILNGELVIVDDYSFNNIVNVSCSKLSDDSCAIYIVFKAIKEKLIKKFFRLEIEDDDSGNVEKVKYYLCYGIEDEYFKVIDKINDNRVDIDYLRKGKVKILGVSDVFKKELVEYLSQKYEDKRVKEILDNAIVEES